MLFEKMLEVADPEPHGAALNMAIDEVLLRTAQAPLLRIYRWARPAVSFGYFGKHIEVARAWAGREAVRRWTGGGIVPHGEDLTYTLIVPREHVFARQSARESYRLIHDGVASALREAGHRVTLAALAQPKISNACFENPAESDLLAESGKIAGAAQRRTSAGLLHQGSIQLRGQAPDLAKRLPATFAAAIEVRSLEPHEIELAEQLAAEKYATEAWLNRF